MQPRAPNTRTVGLARGLSRGVSAHLPRRCLRPASGRAGHARAMPSSESPRGLGRGATPTPGPGPNCVKRGAGLLRWRRTGTGTATATVHGDSKQPPDSERRRISGQPFRLVRAATQARTWNRAGLFSEPEPELAPRLRPSTSYAEPRAGGPWPSNAIITCFIHYQLKPPRPFFN